MSATVNSQSAPVYPSRSPGAERKGNLHLPEWVTVSVRTTQTLFPRVLVYVSIGVGRRAKSSLIKQVLQTRRASTTI